jgi:hypothetical protein
MRILPALAHTATPASGKQRPFQLEDVLECSIVMGYFGGEKPKGESLF